MAIADHIGISTEGYEPVSPPSSQQQDQPLLPTRDSKLRFSAPNIPGAFPSSDTLTGFHLGGMVPQYRIPTAPMQSGTSSTSTIATSVVTTGGGGTTTNNPPKAQTASATTSVLSPAGQFTGVITMAKAFVVLSVSVNTAARVRLYGTASSQTTDLARPITQGPGFGTEQSIIGDMVLDTAPVVWQAVDMVGANGDSPQSTAVYITVDNLSVMSTDATVTIVYVPIQS